MSEDIDNLSDDELADKFMSEIAEDGIDSEHAIHSGNGVGDAIEGFLTKFGVTPAKIERMFGIGGCGCSGRKKFLNKILPFFNSTKDNANKEEG